MTHESDIRELAKAIAIRFCGSVGRDYQTLVAVAEDALIASPLLRQSAPAQPDVDPVEVRACASSGRNAQNAASQRICS